MPITLLTLTFLKTIVQGLGTLSQDGQNENGVLGLKNNGGADHPQAYYILTPRKCEVRVLKSCQYSGELFVYVLCLL